MEIIKEKNRVYIQEDKLLAYMTFPFVEEHVVCIDHTFVDESLRGMGIASQLMHACLEVIEDNNYKVILECSYAIGYFNKHSELKKLLK